MGPGYAVNPLKHRERDPAACAAPKPRPQRGIAIERVQPLRHEALLKYLTGTRCLDDPRILHAYLEEVYFINHGVPSPRLFYAIGFQNDAGGYELRNARFKGSAAPKRIRTVPGADARTVALFEGWTDFLSFLHHHRTVTPPTDCLVLNSTKLLQHAIDAIRQREEPCTAIVCYPHHDEEGQAVVAAMREAFPCIPVTDRGGSYAPHNDYNAWWQACSHAGRMESA
jgi:hypothetical protein